MCSTASNGSVRKCRSGWLANTHPKMTSRYSDADSDSTGLLPTRSAIGPHTRVNSTLVVWLSTVNPITALSDNPSSLSIYTAKNGIARFETRLHTNRNLTSCEKFRSRSGSANTDSADLPDSAAAGIDGSLARNAHHVLASPNVREPPISSNE